MKPTQIVQTIYQMIKAQVANDISTYGLPQSKGFNVVTYSVENRDGNYKVVANEFALFPNLKQANLFAHTSATLIIEESKYKNHVVIIYDTESKRIIDRENGLYCSFEWVLTIEGIRFTSFMADEINIDKKFETLRSQISGSRIIDDIYPASQAWSFNIYKLFCKF